MTKKVTIAFGAMCRPLYQQLKVPANDVMHFQQDADCITRLHVRGLLSESQANSARLKLVKDITNFMSTRE